MSMSLGEEAGSSGAGDGAVVVAGGFAEAKRGTEIGDAELDTMVWRTDLEGNPVRLLRGRRARTGHCARACVCWKGEGVLDCPACCP